MFSAANRLSIFVDGNNMFYAQQKNGWFFDPRRVLEYFTKEPELMLINAFWYTGLKDAQDQRGFSRRTDQSGIYSSHQDPQRILR